MKLGIFDIDILKSLDLNINKQMLRLNIMKLTRRRNIFFEKSYQYDNFFML